MEIEVYQLPDAFDMPQWRRLLEADPHRHIFATPEWNRLWWQSFGEPRQSGFAVGFINPGPEDSSPGSALDPDRPSPLIGMAPLTIDKTPQGRRVRFLGGDDLTDYQGPLIAGQDYRPVVAEAFLGFLLEDFDGWDYLEAKGLPVPFHFSEWLVEAADRMGLVFDLELHELTAVLMLPTSWSQYLAGLGKKRRHELERKMRRFDREAAAATLRTSDGEHLESDIQTFIELHKTSAGAKGEFMLPEREDFFRSVARTLQPLGMLSLDLLEFEGRTIAATISFRYDGVFYLYNSAYDLSLRPISPGLILVARLIQRSIDEGARRFDFLRGRERYKYDLGAEALPLHSILIRREHRDPVS